MPEKWIFTFVFSFAWLVLKEKATEEQRRPRAQPCLGTGTQLTSSREEGPSLHPLSCLQIAFLALWHFLHLLYEGQHKEASIHSFYWWHWHDQVMAKWRHICHRSFKFFILLLVVILTTETLKHCRQPFVLSVGTDTFAGVQG